MRPSIIVFSLLAVSLPPIATSAFAEVWTCHNTTSDRQFFTNRPTQNSNQSCKQHRSGQGSYSSVSSQYFDLNIREIEDLRGVKEKQSTVPKSHNAINVRLLADQEEKLRRR